MKICEGVERCLRSPKNGCESWDRSDLREERQGFLLRILILEDFLPEDRVSATPILNFFERCFEATYAIEYVKNRRMNQVAI